MSFLTEPEPIYGIKLNMRPGLSRIVANNPGLMTYHGTNTYLIESGKGYLVLDPGPDDPRHLEAILAGTNGAVASILISHTHSDHCGAVAELKARTGATTYGFHLSADPRFVPDVPLRHGDIVEEMTVLHTPGHASDHICFARPDGILFSADHVMSWSSSVVSPPGGDMRDYCNSLGMLLERAESLFLPGHGPPLPDPIAYVQSLLNHRLARERAILGVLKQERLGTWELVDRLYSKRDPRLRRAAERNVSAHLLKLKSEGAVDQANDVWFATA